jgi:hypothetical protein
MIVKAVFLISFISFTVFSFLIALPPGTLVTQAANLSFPYSGLLTNNLLNGLFFATIIGLGTYLYKRNSEPVSSFSITSSSFDRDIDHLLNDEQKDVASSLTKIKGIGPNRAMDLELAGVKTISDLAKRSPKHLAEKTGIPISQISKWIVEANKLTNK